MKLKCREVKFAADAKGAARYRDGRASSGNVKQDTRLCGYAIDREFPFS